MKLINKIEQGIINTPSYLKTNLNNVNWGFPIK